MLQNAHTSNHPPQMIAKSRARKRMLPSSSLDIIQASIMPLGDEPDLVNELLFLKDENSIAGIIALYDAYVAVSKAFLSIQNQPRAAGRSEDFMEIERCRAMSKAYLVADFLKDLSPSRLETNAYARVMFECALEMGNNADEGAALVQEIVASAQHIPAGTTLRKGAR